MQAEYKVALALATGFSLGAGAIHGLQLQHRRPPMSLMKSSRTRTVTKGLPPSGAKGHR